MTIILSWFKQVNFEWNTFTAFCDSRLPPEAEADTNCDSGVETELIPPQ